MCGICGIAYADDDRRVDASRVEAMNAFLSHRGPDDQGVFVSRNVGLGHRRLSIVDVAGGHQPMSNEDGSVWITFNGEIYNHAGFRSLLEGRGHRYRSRCDTEAIVHLYEEHGEDTAADLHGMFAFAIWDERKRRLVLARDRLGIKPLYYATTARGDLAFASEVKAIFASGLVKPELETEVVREYFATGHVARGRTLYRGIRKLEPGHVLTWQRGKTSCAPYWRIADYPPPAVTPRLPAERDASEFWERFREAVRRMLMADVPLGVFLSGGLDSSLIVAAMRACGVEHLRTFSVGFDDVTANELPYARTVASAFRTDHHEVLVSPDEFFAAIPNLTWHRDFPLTFSASIPLFFVSRLARDGVKVVLTGEGSDELFGGYGRYTRGLHNLRLARAFDALLPGMLRDGLAAAASRLDDHYVGNRVKRSFLAKRGTFRDAYLEAFADFDEEHRGRLLRDSIGGDPYERATSLLDVNLLAQHPLEAILRLDQATYLEELLAKQDHMSMAASIESRVPFLDEDLVDWAARLDTAAKLRGGVGKSVVRRAAAARLPESIVRGRKRGFTVPLATWLRGPGKRWWDNHVAPLLDRNDLFNEAYVRRLMSEHVKGRDHSSRLWRILAFETWRSQSFQTDVNPPRTRGASRTVVA